MESEAMEIIHKLDDMGGMVAAIKNGYPMMAIAESSRKYQQQVEKKEKIIVGVNEFILEDEEPMEVLKISHDVEKRQMQKLQALRDERDDAPVKEKLAELRQKVKANQNIMPALIDCAHAYCTIGEIAQVLRDEYGEYHDPGIFWNGVLVYWCMGVLVYWCMGVLV